MKLEDKLRLFLDVPYMCDSCLGRQFGQLLTGMTNRERGHALRIMLAMMADAESKQSEQVSGISMRNGSSARPGTCWVCHGIMDRINKIAKKVAKSIKVEYDTFVIGIRLSSELLEAEEKLWEMVGVEYCEPIKKELSREIGKAVESISGKKFSQTPDVEAIVNLENMSIEVNVKPVFVYGEYQKLVRGISQTRWEKYSNSVEKIIGQPFKTAFRSADYKLHAAGREDVDARCLGWRPFVLELISPRKRRADLRKLMERINASGKVRVKKLRYSDAKEMRELKAERFLKEYVAVVETERPVSRADLRKLKSLEGKTIRQRTPLRVIHRRADKLRKRKILKISATPIDSHHFRLRVAAEAGTYIKELISGDRKRTSPSVSSIIGPAVCKELDVVRIWKGSK